MEKPPYEQLAEVLGGIAKFLHGYSGGPEKPTGLVVILKPDGVWHWQFLDL